MFEGVSGGPPQLTPVSRTAVNLIVPVKFQIFSSLLVKRAVKNDDFGGYSSPARRKKQSDANGLAGRFQAPSNTNRPNTNHLTDEGEHEFEIYIQIYFGIYA